MPPYLRLGSIPRKRHTSIPTNRASRARESITKKWYGSPGSPRPTASSITCGRRPAWSASSRRDDPGRFRSISLPCAIIIVKTRTIPSPGDPVSGRVVLLATTTSRWPAAAPSSPSTSCFATPTPTRSSSSIAAAGRLHTMFGPLAVSRVRLYRHSPLHDLSPRIRAGLPARPAGDRGGRQHVDPAAGISTPTAS